MDGFQMNQSYECEMQLKGESHWCIYKHAFHTEVLQKSTRRSVPRPPEDPLEGTTQIQTSQFIYLQAYKNAAVALVLCSITLECRGSVIMNTKMSKNAK